jgi:precorrin-6B methylase 2
MLTPLGLNSCGWGSATLFLADQLPNSKVVGFSNSRTQKQHIDSVAAKRNLKNVEVITEDIADYEFDAERFDRVVSVEVKGGNLSRHSFGADGTKLLTVSYSSSNT